MAPVRPAPERPVVDVRDVTVRYRVPHERVPTFKEFAIRWMRRRLVYQEFLALSAVTFSIRGGESVGIVGRNGAGKTTLLKVIARVLRPSRGTVAVRGRVAPLLELGAGFDPELSGRENVFLNGALLGRSRREMRERFARIVEFAELEEFIDAPLRTYSTGMVARLGFAVATDVEADVLLLDEVLSVGDFAFQKKSYDRITSFLGGGATFLLVSHSPDVVRQLCQRAIWVEGGRIVADGPAGAVIDAFTGGAAPAAPPADALASH
ncbi:MAG TPA: ABC transporter ATP-binding protein [Candidatus Eisenbacteria bacterium]|nr:ABC transporter ATP-binding protein [Candidatus Eisenbacteria bacterium]